MDNQGFSKIGIVVIIVILLSGGILAWQYFGAPEEKVEAPEEAVGEVDKCKEIQDSVKQAKCYTDLAKETKDESYCGKIEVPGVPEIRGDCYGWLAFLKNDPLIKYEEKIETVDWKTYRNEEYGYEFKYPQNIESFGELNLKKNFTDLKVTTTDPGYEKCKFYHTGGQVIINGERLKINGIDFCALLDENQGGGKIDVDHKYITKRNGKYFTIHLSGTYANYGWCRGLQCKDFGDVRILFTKILSTFRFLE